ncbi:hypothetical protein AYI69_g977 [Smittium culicis]|uniref:Uncharacterized protein n=1 Tax=Smittium culicis TaxID=133412 RepID=A0A1R1YRK0_9FUNG|nr:hypothetical protein AYI69_g977 [Smittium culicis]
MYGLTPAPFLALQIDDFDLLINRGSKHQTSPFSSPAASIFPSKSSAVIAAVEHTLPPPTLPTVNELSAPKYPTDNRHLVSNQFISPFSEPVYSSRECEERRVVAAMPGSRRAAVFVVRVYVQIPNNVEVVIVHFLRREVVVLFPAVRDCIVYTYRVVDAA